MSRTGVDSSAKRRDERSQSRRNPWAAIRNLGAPGSAQAQFFVNLRGTVSSRDLQNKSKEENTMAVKKAGKPAKGAKPSAKQVKVEKNVSLASLKVFYK
jgi:hypothetical protein